MKYEITVRREKELIRLEHNCESKNRKGFEWNFCKGIVQILRNIKGELKFCYTSYKIYEIWYGEQNMEYSNGH